MITPQFSNLPPAYKSILNDTKALNFSMSSGLEIGSLLKTLVSSKSSGNILEIGTGTGLALCWMIEGLERKGKIISIDNDANVLSIAKKHFAKDTRIDLFCTDAEEWIEHYTGPPFDLIFADAWPGKFSHLNQILALVKEGGFYVIDDLLPQSNWPEGHQEKVIELINSLKNKKGFSLVQLNWATGIIILAKNTKIDGK